MKCDICKDKRYLICTRSDGREAVERCDSCQDWKAFSDEDAAVLAQADGIGCSPDYPCVIKGGK